MKRSADQERMWRIAGRYSAVGIEMAIAVALGTLGGTWLDDHFGTKPYLFIAGLVIGIGAAANAIVRVVKNTKLNKL